MDVGGEPSAEMKAAIMEAEQRQLQVALIDRDIKITLKRFWHGMTFWEKLKMFYALSISIVGVKGEEIDVDSLTNQDVVTMALEEFRKFSPNGARALIDERDAYLAYNLHLLNTHHERVLAIVGAGHVKGIQQYLANPSAIPSPQNLTAEVRTFPWGRIFGGAVVALFALLILAIAFSGVGLNVLIFALIYWVLIHGILTFVFTLALGGHPLSALTGFGVSWLTALNPLVAAG
jgi:pheromone shutdown-related protein TraB